jgi:Ras-related GTP-binding protein C/D
VDVKTKLYIATDSNPVDVHTYELCSDLVDVVIDVCYIYVVKNAAAAASPKSQVEWATPYDEDSASAIRLNSGMVLYLREVSDLLALVCVLREEFFFKRSLLDYNIDCLKVSLGKVMKANNAGKADSSQNPAKLTAAVASQQRT